MFPHRPRTEKGKETGLGKGKGGIMWWGARVRKGQIMIEYMSMDMGAAKRIEEEVSSKLPIKTEFIWKLLPHKNLLTK